MGYFGISDYYRPVPELDQWLRRRVRMCYWKQWRYVRTKVRNLLALGTSKRQAIMTGLSSKSYWHLSRTLATQTGMTNDWLKSQGLISVRDLWMKVHGYACERRVLPSCEPPSADPHARWCGEGGLNTRPYPIRAHCQTSLEDLPITTQSSCVAQPHCRAPLLFLENVTLFRYLGVRHCLFYI